MVLQQKSYASFKKSNTPIKFSDSSIILLLLHHWIYVLRIYVPNLNTIINWTLNIEWHVVRCGYKIWHQKHMCLREIALCAQNMLIILGSIVNIIGTPIWPLNEHVNLHFDHG